jgi:hypothetical protein
MLKAKKHLENTLEFITFVVGKLLGTPQGGRWLQERYKHKKSSATLTSNTAETKNKKLSIHEKIKKGILIK